MLKTFAIALLATAISVGFAEAKGHKQKALSPCENGRAATATCACGPAKMVCPKGMWCQAFVSACTQ